MNLGDRDDEAKRRDEYTAKPGRRRVRDTSSGDKFMIGLIILIALPLIEIAVMIKVGQWLGIWPTIGIVLGTFLVGAAVIGRSGLNSAIKVRDALAAGQPPVAAMLDSSMVVIAGVLLITPGFIADAIGLALLIPPFRTWVARIALRNAFIVGGVGVESEAFSKRSNQKNAHRPETPAETRHDSGPGPVIDGDFERLDERPVDPGKRRRPDPDDRR
jgi:UPF0716 protein FxsA